LVIVILAIAYYIWAGRLLERADVEFRQYVRSSSPEILESMDRSAIQGISRIQFLMNPWRKEIELEYVYTYPNGTTDYSSGYSGGLRASKKIDARWTVEKLRAFGPS
jgi:hypothetical protein